MRWVIGDVPVGGDGGPVAGLEVVPEVLGPGKQADTDGLAPYRHLADPTKPRVCSSAATP
jgi:hypothetical protein